MRSLVRQAEKQGFRVKRTRNGYMIFGKEGGMVTLHLTCSDHRAKRNAESELRKLGLRLK